MAMVREGVQKNETFYGQPDRKRWPSPPLRSAFCDFFGCTFDLILWLHVFWNGFYTRKVIFIQLQEFPTPPYCRCCSVTKRSDSGIAEALKALKMHFWDPSQWDKMCFEYHRVIFHWKNGSKFSHLLTVRAEVAGRKRSAFLTPSLTPLLNF